MKKAILLALAVALVLATGAAAQSVVGTLHDLSSGGGGTPPLESTNVDRVCVFCHTPHQATSAGGQDPLWNHTKSANTGYGVYGSDTLNAGDIAEIAGTGTSVSSLCMSCHDGSVGVGSLYNNPNGAGGSEITPDNSGAQITGNADLGDGASALADDHPINFTYDSSLAGEDGGLKTPVSGSFVDAANEVPLFAGTVQCASCHDPHDDQQIPFLVADNAASALCIKCHNK